jgi:hypothetical protein
LNLSKTQSIVTCNIDENAEYSGEAAVNAFPANRVGSNQAVKNIVVATIAVTKVGSITAKQLRIV